MSYSPRIMFFCPRITRIFTNFFVLIRVIRGQKPNFFVLIRVIRGQNLIFRVNSCNSWTKKNTR